MFRIHLFWLLGLSYIMLSGCKEDDFPVPPPSTVPDFTFVIDNEAEAPATATFTNTSIVPEIAGQASYYWNFGDGASSEEVNPVHTYTQSGAFEVNLVVVTSASAEIRQTSKTLVIKNPNASGVPIYFTDGSFVYKGLVNEEAPVFEQLPVSGIQSSYGMTIDTVHDHLYISDYDGGLILRTNLDGEDQVIFRNNLIGPNGLAIDYQMNQLYWDTDSGIQRGDLGNSATDQFEDFVTGQPNDPDGIAIDASTRTLFWVNYNGGVWRKKLDGTGEMEIVTLVEGGSIVTAGDRIYFDQYIASGDIHLKSSSFDGSGVAILATGITRVVYGLAFEPDGLKIYWGDRNPGVIMRANLDGSAAEPFYTRAGSSPRGIVFGKKF